MCKCSDYWDWRILSYKKNGVPFISGKPVVPATICTYCIIVISHILDRIVIQYCSLKYWRISITVDTVFEHRFIFILNSVFYTYLKNYCIKTVDFINYYYKIQHGRSGYITVDESSGEISPGQPRPPTKAQAAAKSGALLNTWISYFVITNDILQVIIKFYLIYFNCIYNLKILSKYKLYIMYNYNNLSYKYWVVYIRQLLHALCALSLCFNIYDIA